MPDKSNRQALAIFAMANPSTIGDILVNNNLINLGSSSHSAIDQSAIRIAIICVTFNRLEMLKELLKSYSSQSQHITSLYIVNNNSSDGTKEFLEEWSKDNRHLFTIFIEHMKKNVGGSGGFAKATEMVLREPQEYDFVYFADDDAFPAPNLFKDFSNLPLKGDESAICTKVMNNGVIDVMHRRTLKLKQLRVIEYAIPESAYNSNFELNAYSFVGVFIRSIALKSEIPRSDFFIHYDDTEHALRVSKHGRILCVPNLVVFHNTPDTGDLTGWKLYYNIRNKLHTCKSHFPLYALPLTILQTLYVNFKNWLFKPKFFVYAKLVLLAMFNGLLGRLGLHNKYAPGQAV